MTQHNILRRCVFTPYRKGCGPAFRLVTWDTDRRDSYGKWILGYRLTMQAKLRHSGKRGVVLFEGEDFGCSPLHAIDSDDAVVSLMAFLTCRPGDTDAEYFASYTPKQLAYCSEHAEALACCVSDRFGDNVRPKRTSVRPLLPDSADEASRPCKRGS